MVGSLRNGDGGNPQSKTSVERRLWRYRQPGGNAWEGKKDYG
jgi:hypothetical protein